MIVRCERTSLRPGSKRAAPPVLLDTRLTSIATRRCGAACTAARAGRAAWPCRRRRRPRCACRRSASRPRKTSRVGTERRLGDQIMREIRRDPELPRRPGAAGVPAVAVATRWWPRRASAATSTPTPTSAFAWEIFLVRDRSVNAFALPGGYVGVHLGLIAHDHHARRAGLGAGARAVARHAAPHRAQHRAAAARPRWWRWRP